MRTNQYLDSGELITMLWIFKKAHFSKVLKLALDSIGLTKSAQNGFRACGLYPLNPDAVNYNILNKQKKGKPLTPLNPVLLLKKMRITGICKYYMCSKKISFPPVNWELSKRMSSTNHGPEKSVIRSYFSLSFS